MFEFERCFWVTKCHKAGQSGLGEGRCLCRFVLGLHQLQVSWARSGVNVAESGSGAC